jgi:phage terminase large subunit-like protein
VLLTGRGWGKTRTAAELVRKWATEKPNQFIAVVAKNETLVREICFESKKSGLLAVIPPDMIRSYIRSAGNVHIVLTNGSVIRGFGGEVPDNLRGWAFDKGWCDEYAAWNRHTAQGVYDMLWFCLREADVPQVVVSTTPKPLPHIVKLVTRHKKQVKRLIEQAEAHANGEEVRPPAEGPRVVLTTGHMRENIDNLAEAAVEELEDDYQDTRLGDQELGGILLEDVEGALWQAWMFEIGGFRMELSEVPPTDRVVVAVDPATTSTETADESGIAVCARGHWRDQTHRDQRPRGYVLASEAKRLTPMQTMRRAAELYHLWKADAIILEANNGGEYLSTVLSLVDPTVNVRVVNATRDKRARAAPVAGLYEQGRIHHVGPPAALDKLETVMTTYVGAPEKDEKSPDILDAMVWAMWDLFLDPTAPGTRGDGRDRRSEGRR